VSRESFEDIPEGAQSETLLFGWMMAELQEGRRKEAERPYRELLKRFPDSKYAARARENFAAAATQ
jgi:outer membrane protein assembly factor BamD (BamD/ComL family)